MLRRLVQAVMLPWMLLAWTLIASGPARASQDFLEPEKAFVFRARLLDAATVEVGFDVARGYYMYREQFKFSADGATLGQAQIPPGTVKFDATFNKEVQTHRNEVRIRIPVQEVQGPGFTLRVVSQGCADAGLCYPPMTSTAQLVLASAPAAGTAPPPAQASRAADIGSSEHVGRVLGGGSLPLAVAAFFVMGLLLSFTPCVLPMLPILSSVIAGQAGSGAAAISRGRGFTLAAAYSLGMALVYTALGVAAGLAGEGLAATLQQPWVLGLFALLLVGLALSMFGLYELQLPSALATRLQTASQRLPGGQLAGVTLMGGLSAVIVSPCVTAPLAGALLFISQSGNVVLGGAALLALAAGMSVPLLALGASAGAWLPKAGAWMLWVKRLFGLMLLGVALYMVQPALPEAWRLPWLGGSGSLGGTSARLAPAERPSFTLVRSQAELDAALQAAPGRIAMLDFYADWCVSCKEMENFTFSDPAVAALMRKALLLKADVTAHNDDDRALLKRFKLFGPPGIIFFDAQGREMPGLRVIGFQNAERFAQSLRAAGL